MRGELCTTRAPAKADRAGRYSVPPAESSELLLLFLLRTLHRILRCRSTSRLACWKSPDGPRRRSLSRSRRKPRTLRKPERNEMACPLLRIWKGSQNTDPYHEMQEQRTFEIVLLQCSRDI